MISTSHSNTEGFFFSPKRDFRNPTYRIPHAFPTTRNLTFKNALPTTKRLNCYPFDIKRLSSPLITATLIITVFKIPETLDTEFQMHNELPVLLLSNPKFTNKLKRRQQAMRSKKRHEDRGQTRTSRKFRILDCFCSSGSQKNRNRKSKNLVGEKIYRRATRERRSGSIGLRSAAAMAKNEKPKSDCEHN